MCSPDDPRKISNQCLIRVDIELASFIWIWTQWTLHFHLANFGLFLFICWFVVHESKTCVTAVAFFQTVKHQLLNLRPTHGLGTFLPATRTLRGTTRQEGQNRCLRWWIRVTLGKHDIWHPNPFKGTANCQGHAFPWNQWWPHSNTERFSPVRVESSCQNLRCVFTNVCIAMAEPIRQRHSRT